MLVLAPIACVLGGIAVNETLTTYSKFVKPRPKGVPKPKDAPEDLPLAREVGYIMIAGTVRSLLLLLPNTII